MPTYQYLCTDCSNGFDMQQSFTDDALTVCPDCDGRLRKVFNAVGVVFKGSGFYKTDSRNAQDSGGSGTGGSGSGSSGDTAASSGDKSASASESSSDTGSAKESAPAASTTSDSKPAPKKEASAASSTA